MTEIAVDRDLAHEQKESVPRQLVARRSGGDRDSSIDFVHGGFQSAGRLRVQCLIAAVECSCPMPIPVR